jgi:hypothetical protein
VLQPATTSHRWHRPLLVTAWPDVEQLVLAHQQAADDTQRLFQVPDPLLALQDERTLVTALTMAVLEPLSRIHATLRHSEAGLRWSPTAPAVAARATAAAAAAAAQTAAAAAHQAASEAGLPAADAAARSEGEPGHWGGRCGLCLELLGEAAGATATPLAVGEMKRPGVIRHSAARPSLAERWQSADAAVRNVVSQLFECMVDSGVGYGLLSTLQHTWLVRRLPASPGDLQVAAAGCACGWASCAPVQRTQGVGASFAAGVLAWQ